MPVGKSRRRVRVRPIVEQLELRAVLSVCGVTCELTDGVLSVAGTDGGDSIALRYDTSAGLVSVVGGENELIGRFPLWAVQSVNVAGGAGDDRFEVDSHLPLAISLEGGEGEDLFAALTPSGHSHGGQTASFDPSNIELFGSAISPAATAASGPAFGPSLGPALIGSSAFGGMLPVSAPAFTGNSALPLLALSSNLGLLSTFSLLGAHDQHSPALSAVLVDPHGYHAAGVAGAVGTLGAATTFTAFSSAAATDDSAWLPAGAADGQSGAGGHHGRGESPSAEVVAKFAPKRCTVRLTSKEVARNVSGEKKCDCAQKKAAAEAAAHRAAAADQAPATTTETAAATTPAACPRCQMAALAPELAADMALAGEVCDLPLNDEVLVATASARPVPSSTDEAMTAGEWSFLGLTLAAAGLVVAPTFRRRRLPINYLGLERLAS